MKYDLIVISGDSLDSAPSVGFFFQDYTYIFNVPDQAQRVYRELDLRTSKIRHIFLTNMTARALGGFHGLLITIFDVIKQGSPHRLNFTAPAAFAGVLETYQELHTQPELRPTNSFDFSDENLTVVTHALHASNAYEVHLRAIPGRFQVERARQLGLPSGPLYRQLMDGKAVTAPDGRLITARKLSLRRRRVILSLSWTVSRSRTSSACPRPLSARWRSISRNSTS
jgi:ribonuclease Z